MNKNIISTLLLFSKIAAEDPMQSMWLPYDKYRTRPSANHISYNELLDALGDVETSGNKSWLGDKNKKGEYTAFGKYQMHKPAAIEAGIKDIVGPLSSDQLAFKKAITSKGTQGSTVRDLPNGISWQQRLMDYPTARKAALMYMWKNASKRGLLPNNMNIWINLNHPNSKKMVMSYNGGSGVLNSKVFDKFTDEKKKALEAYWLKFRGASQKRYESNTNRSRFIPLDLLDANSIKSPAQPVVQSKVNRGY